MQMAKRNVKPKAGKKGGKKFIKTTTSVKKQPKKGCGCT